MIDMDDFLTKLVTESKSILLLLLVLIMLGHFLFIYILKVKEKSWIFLEYVALFFASLGLITLTAGIRTGVAKNYLRSAEARVKGTFDQLKYYVHDGSPSYICRSFIKTEFSPQNFEEVQQEYDKACDWYQRLNSLLPDSLDPAFSPLKLDNLPEADFSEPVIVESINWINTLIKEYESERIEMTEIKRKANTGDFESAMYFLSPLFICITLAIAITKKTWDLKQSSH